jgi:ligand-binding sensor domain-containing protein/signal transduction histidine kinase
MSDGLPHVTAHTVTQTRDGYIWVGTMKGIARFNGDTFSTVQNTNTPGLSNTRVSSLCQTRDGTLWVGLYAGNVIRLPEGKISHASAEKSLHLNSVLDIFEADDGTVWIGTIDGAIRYKDGVFTPFEKTTLLGNSTVKKMCRDEQKNIWLATSAGLVCWSNSTAILVRSNSFVRSVCNDRSGGVWYGGPNFVGHWERGKITELSKDDGLTDASVTALYLDQRKTLWIGTYNGLTRYTEGRFYTEATTESDPYDQIYGINEDAEGNIWIAAKDGLYRLKRKTFFSYTVQQGLANNNVTAVLQKRDGTIAFTTWEGGLHELTNHRLAVHNNASGKPFGNDMLLSLCETKSGDLWIGSDFDSGLFRWRKGAPGPDPRESYNVRAVRAICESTNGDLFIATSSGLIVNQAGVYKTFATNEGLPTPRIRTVQLDSLNRLWVGTERGAGLWNMKSHRFEAVPLLEPLSRHSVVEVFEDSRHVLWFGTLGAGLYRLDKDSLTHLGMENGLPSDDVYEVLEDNDHNYWFSCFRGVFSVNGSDLNAFTNRVECVLYDKSDGMASSQCNGSSKPAAWKSNDGRLWFATSKGLATIDPKATLNRKAFPTPKVFVERIISGTNDLLLDPVSHLAEPIRIRPGASEIEFQFATLSYRAPERNKMRYQLTGVDPDWMDADASHSAVYKGIGPGRYEFRVMAADCDGNWNHRGATIGFILLPRFWQTWWWRTLCVATAMSVVGLVVRYNTNKNLQRKLDLLERQNAVQRERTRIAQDMHDDLGARLTEILFLSDVVADESRKPGEMRGHVHRISTAARELVRNLDVIVWALNPKNDSLDNFALYVIEYVENFLSPTGIRCRLDVPDELPAVPISSEVRHNLFLVIKEALNNIAKHSCASEVWFRLRFEKQQLAISIEDNGKGFNSGKTNALGNGLVNMEKRMQSIGGCFEIQSERNNAGTQIRLLIVLRKS